MNQRLPLGILFFIGIVCGLSWLVSHGTVFVRNCFKVSSSMAVASTNGLAEKQSFPFVSHFPHPGVSNSLNMERTSFENHCKASSSDWVEQSVHLFQACPTRSLGSISIRF